MESRTPHIPELDGLRGLAIAGVICFHLGTITHLPHALASMADFGWSGVDMFFVLSGFLIGGILMDQRQSESYFAPFYARRFFRIVPLYAALLALYALAWFLGNRNGVNGYLLPAMPWWAYCTFTNNFWISFGGSMVVYLAPTWSLAIEEQFYVTLPWVVRYLRPRALLPLLSVACVVVLALRCYGTFGLRWSYERIYTLTFFRIDALLLGVICAILVRSQRAKEILSRNYRVLALLAVFCAAIVYHADYTIFPYHTNALMSYGLTAVALMYACILLLTVLRPASFRLLRLLPLTELGKVSYCLYLIHMIAFDALRLYLAVYAKHWRAYERWSLILFVLFAMFLVAQFSWSFFESRMLRFGRRFNFNRPAQPQIAPVESSV
jgi:peptidoglycan/LPS O-acetylase OafA/YrhL